MDPKLELIANYECGTGENPLWHPVEKRLYWVDIPNGRLFRYDPATGKHENFYTGDVIGGFTFQADGGLLLFMAHGGVKLWHDGKLTDVISHMEHEEGSRFNDVIADPEGRVFCGTMPFEQRMGSLYRLDTDGSIHHIMGDVSISNGMGFTLDRKQMYYTDSRKHVIYIFDVDQATGELSNQRDFVRTDPNEGVPDGMTVDAEGYVWSARWDGYCLVRYTPEGKEEQRINFPTKKVSSVIFGGKDYTDMYVTTAGGYDKAENGETAGALYRVNVGIRGLPEFYSKVRVNA
ncbi:MAG: SMP-30/gluconolactonase/LRE family protein [Chloroflexi bacterium]|nr:SMP-30/gluconolactonase/LRE family protein [Chloroflexota bacterium]